MNNQNLTTEIFDLFQKDWSYQQIADKLNISKSMAFALTKQNPQFEQVEQIKQEKQNQLINEVLRLHNEPNTYRQIATKLNITSTKALRIVKNNQNIITPTNIREWEEDRHEIFEEEDSNDLENEDSKEKHQTENSEMMSDFYNYDKFSEEEWENIKHIFQIGSSHQGEIIAIADNKVILKLPYDVTGACRDKELTLGNKMIINSLVSVLVIGLHDFDREVELKYQK